MRPQGLTICSSIVYDREYGSSCTGQSRYRRLERRRRSSSGISHGRGQCGSVLEGRAIGDQLSLSQDLLDKLLLTGETLLAFVCRSLRGLEAVRPIDGRMALYVCSSITRSTGVFGQTVCVSGLVPCCDYNTVVG